MAKRPTRLTRIDEDPLSAGVAADRRRSAIDEARASGPAGAGEEADGADAELALDDPAEGADDGGFGLPTVEGRAEATRAEAEAEAAAAIDPGAGAPDARDRVGSRPFEEGRGGDPGDGRVLDGRSSISVNPIRDAQRAQESSGVTPGDNDPSFEDGGATANFARNVEKFRDITGDDTPEPQADGSVVFAGEGGTLRVDDDSFVFQDEDQTTAGVITDGAFGVSTIDNETGEEKFSGGATTRRTEKAETEGATTKTEVVTKDPVTGSVTTTTSTTTTTTTTPAPSTSSIEIPREESAPRPRTERPVSGSGQQGGETDPNDDEIAFAVSPGAQLPANSAIDLVGNPVSPDFGSGAVPEDLPTGSGFNDPGALDPTDDSPDAIGSGPEDDPFDTAPDPLPPAPTDEPDDFVAFRPPSSEIGSPVGPLDDLTIDIPPDD